MNYTNEKKNGKSDFLISGAGILACIILGFLLVCNLTIIIKGTLSPERPPSVFGVTPMVVLSGSMSGTAEDHIEAGDLIFVKEIQANDLKEGNIISFMEEKSSTVVTHRIIEIIEDSGGRTFITKGDANNTEDQSPVTEDRIVGVFFFRLAKVGDFALFLHEPLGMLLFIGVPVLGFIIYDIIRRQKAAKAENKKTSELEAELERLRKLAGEKADEPSAKS